MDGQAGDLVVGNGMSGERMLHVLPKLYVEDEELGTLGCDDISVSVHVPEQGWNLEPEGGVVVRQPYPNNRYFVGGSRESRHGWWVPLPRSADQFVMVIEWYVAEGARVPGYTIRHHFRVRLLPGETAMYSMEKCAWPCGGAYGFLRSEGGPYTPLYGTPFGPHRGLVAKWGRDGSKLDLWELLQLPPIDDKAIAYLAEAWQDEQLHEVEHITSFKVGDEEHRRNACVEMPASVFVRAVTAADLCPRKAEGSWGPLEEHPAMRCLCDWWNEHAPDPLARCARIPQIWVRVRDDGEYWNAYYETPNAAIECFSEDASSQARVGDLVLIQFWKGLRDATFEDDGTTLYCVMGEPTITVGQGRDDCESGDYDEAFYALEGLAALPGRFPAAWEALVAASDAESEDRESIVA